MLRSLASFSVKPNLVGRGLTEKTVQDVMRDLSAVRNKPVPGLVVRSGYSDRTVTVAIQRLVPYHPVYRKNNGKRFAVTKLMVHDPGPFSYIYIQKSVLLFERSRTSFRFLTHKKDNSCFAGDRVLIQKSKPYSRRKHHVVRSIIKMEPGREFLEKVFLRDFYFLFSSSHKINFFWCYFPSIPSHIHVFTTTTLEPRIQYSS